MKKYIYLSMLSGALFLGACEGKDFEIGDQIPERFHKILYLDTYGKQSLTLYNTDEANNYPLVLIKGGSEPTLTAAADILVSSQEEIDNDYSNIEGINYKVVTENCYSLSDPHVEFASSDSYKSINVAINAQAVKACMDSDPTAKWVLPLKVVSETDSINANRNFLFLQLPEVVTPSIGFANTNVSIVDYTYGRVSTIEQKIPFQLDTDNKWDIECTFAPDKAYMDDYNAKNGTVFQLVPADKVTYTESVTLPAGTTVLDYAVTIQGSDLLPGDYMLPIRITETSLFELSANSVYPMAFRIRGQELDREAWTIEASSEELTGENNGQNGHAIHAIDGNAQTFWHSKWSGGNDPLPHELIIDTKGEYTFTQFGLLRRENVDYVKGGKFYISSDKEQWTEVGSFQMKNENGNQIFTVTPTQGRYFKVMITESNNGDNACMAEIYAYGLMN